MTLATSRISDAKERRVRVEGGRVDCRRLGTTQLDRCRECPYLVALHEGATVGGSDHFVLCLDSDLDADVDFAW